MKLPEIKLESDDPNETKVIRLKHQLTRDSLMFEYKFDVIEDFISREDDALRKEVYQKANKDLQDWMDEHLGLSFSVSFHEIETCYPYKKLLVKIDILSSHTELVPG